MKTEDILERTERAIASTRVAVVRSMKVLGLEPSYPPLVAYAKDDSEGGGTTEDANLCWDEIRRRRDARWSA